VMISYGGSPYRPQVL